MKNTKLWNTSFLSSRKSPGKGKCKTSKQREDSCRNKISGKCWWSPLSNQLQQPSTSLSFVLFLNTVWGSPKWLQKFNTVQILQLHIFSPFFILYLPLMPLQSELVQWGDPLENLSCSKYKSWLFWVYLLSIMSDLCQLNIYQCVF